MFRIVRKPEVLCEFLGYVSRIGDADKWEFLRFLYGASQSSLERHYLDFATSLGWIKIQHSEGIPYYIPTSTGRKIGSRFFDSSTPLCLVPQYRKYCELILERVHSNRVKVSLKAIWAELDLTENAFAPPKYQKGKAADFLKRYRRWDEIVGIRTKGRRNFYYRKSLNDLVQDASQHPIQINEAYITGASSSLPESQLPMFAFLLLLLVADQMGVALSTKGVDRLLHELAQAKYSGTNCMLEFLDALGLPVVRDGMVYFLRIPLILETSTSTIEEVLSFLSIEDSGITTWNNLSLIVYNRLVDQGLFGNVTDRIGCSLEINTTENHDVPPRIQNKPGSPRRLVSVLQHDGTFPSRNPPPVVNIFNFAYGNKPFIVPDVVEEVITILERESKVLIEEAKYPQYVYMLKSCLYTPHFLGRLPLLEYDEELSQILSPIGRYLAGLKTTGGYLQGLVTLCYYTNPHVMLASEIVRSDPIAVENLSDRWCVIWDGRSLPFLESLDLILEQQGFQVWNDHYVSDSNRAKLVEDSLVDSLRELNMVELKSSGVLRRTHWFYELSQSQEGMMYFNSRTLRNDLVRRLNAIIAIKGGNDEETIGDSN